MNKKFICTTRLFHVLQEAIEELKVSIFKACLPYAQVCGCVCERIYLYDSR